MLPDHLSNGLRPPRVLLLHAHRDDTAIGCAGTLPQLVRRYPAARILWVSLSSDAQRAAETRNAASRLLQGVREAQVRVEEFRGSYFPSSSATLKDYFETLKSFAPDLILTHSRHDLH